MATSYHNPDLSELECDILGWNFRLSARRLWEHGVMGQVDVTAAAVSAVDWSRQAPRYIDVITLVDGFQTLIGTLEDLDNLPRHDEIVPVTGAPIPAADIERLRPLTLNQGWRSQPNVIELQRTVKRYLYHLSHRQAFRGLLPSFWPPGQGTHAGGPGVFAVPGLYSKLEKHLCEHPPARHTATQWLTHLKSTQTRGLKQEELDRSCLPNWLSDQDQLQPSVRWSHRDLLDAIDWTPLRLSVIPVMQASVSHLAMNPVKSPPVSLLPVREPKCPQAGQLRTVSAYDPILGYRIERIQHETLWGTDLHWQAVTYQGVPIANQRGSVLLSSPEVARRLAANHAQRRLPKNEVAEVWRSYAWCGGEDYREWLVTLPWYQPCATENHFDLRNVLAHVRCDHRQDSEGRRILLIHELQSDWAQEWSRQRRDNAHQGLPQEVGTFVPEPPFGREWTTLVLKLMLLHTAWWNLDGLAWTTGAQQIARFGSGYQWLTTLYDERLTKEADKLLAPHGKRVTTLSLPMKRLNGETPYHRECIEGDVQVHGVILDKAARKAIVSTGFPAWG